MKNVKGFTLVELVATIAIMGMVSLMLFPSVNQLLNSNKTSSCKYYEKAMIGAAKRYIQKESVDIIEANHGSFPSHYTIWAYQLMDAQYLESYQDSKTTIMVNRGDSSSARVLVSYDKNTNTYTYQAKLVCKNASGRILYTK